MVENKPSNKKVKLPDDYLISSEISNAFEDDQSINLGKLFIEARAKKGLTQEQASKALKVRVKIVSDFENGNDLELPGLAYQIGFVRSYSKLIGLDPNQMVQHYKSRHSIDDQRLTYNFLEARKEKKSIFPVLTLSVFLFGLIFYSGWYYNNLSDTSQNKTMNVADSNNMNLDTLDYVKIESQTSDNKNQVKSNVDIKSSDLNLNNTNVLSTNNEKSIESKKVVMNLQNKEQFTIENDLTNEVSAVANERDPDTEMVLKSSGNSWVEIEDLDGNSLITRLMRPGETYVIPKTKGLTLSTGNAGVLSLTYGNIHISKLGDIGEVISSRPLNIEAFNIR